MAAEVMFGLFADNELASEEALARPWRAAAGRWRRSDAIVRLSALREVGLDTLA